jgi:hypothetical protein
VTEADYALDALPPALLSYKLGSVTVRGTARESRRYIGLMILVFAALVEAYWSYTVPIRIPSRQKQQNSSRDETIMVRLRQRCHLIQEWHGATAHPQP